MMIEALKVIGDTELLWLYEDSLKELAMMRRELHWHPIIFQYDERNPGRMVFCLYLRQPEAGPEVIDGQLQIRLYDSGHVDFKAYSGMFNSSPSNDAVDRAVERTLGELGKHEGDMLCVNHGNVLAKDHSLLGKEHWQLKAVADLRQWLCRMQVDTKSK